MKRRALLSSSAAAAAAVLCSGVRASVADRFSEKTKPVDTMNRVDGWTPGSVRPIELKGRRIGEGRPKLIAPTTAKNEKDLLAAVRTLAGLPKLDMIEVRLDYLGRLEPEKYAAVSRAAYEAAGGKIVLVTLRNGTDGGGFVIDDRLYEEANAAIVSEGRADIIDFELFRSRPVIERLTAKAHGRGVKVIISDHEFKFMPDEAEIIRRLLLEEALGADILKIALMAHCPEDALAVMSATAKMRHYYTSRPMLTMAMGKYGVLTRITGEGFGSDLTFASVGGKASAPGQIPLDACAEVLETLHLGMNPQ